MSRAPFDPFLIACGAHAPLVVDAGRRDAPTETRSLAQPYVVVGRLPKADVPLNGVEVSRRHAYFQVIDGRLYGVDLSSRTGTLVAGQPLQTAWIDAGAEVAIGPFGLRFQPHGLGGGFGGNGFESLDPRSAAFGDSRTDLPPALLEVTDSSGRSRSWRMREALALIGHGRLCRPCLRGYGVAEYHCSLVRTPHGLWAVDLLTEWGTAHNGSLVRSCLLAPGDHLTVGPFTIRVRESRETPPIRPRQQSASDAVGSCTVAPDRIEWLPAAPTSAGSLAASAIPAEVADRLLALESRQDSMQSQFQRAMLLMMQAFGGMHREQMEALASEMAEVRRLNKAIDELRAELGRKPEDMATYRTHGVTQESDGASWIDVEAAESDSPRVRRDPREVHAFVSERLAAFERERQSRWSRILSTLTGSS